MAGWVCLNEYSKWTSRRKLVLFIRHTALCWDNSGVLRGLEPLSFLPAEPSCIAHGSCLAGFGQAVHVKFQSCWLKSLITVNYLSSLHHGWKALCVEIKMLAKYYLLGREEKALQPAGQDFRESSLGPLYGILHGGEICKGQEKLRAPASVGTEINL